MTGFSPGLSTVAATIQAAIAPVFLLAGIGAILNVLAGRLSRIIDRTRALEALHPRSTGPEHDRHVWELRILDRRISLINAALVLCVGSAVLVCLVVAMLFTARLVQLPIGTAVAVAFIVAMAMLMGGLVAFLFEVRISLRAIHVRAELLERERA
jgi:MFS family permease